MTAQRRFEDSFITTQKLRRKGAIFVVHQQTKIKKKTMLHTILPFPFIPK